MGLSNDLISQFVQATKPDKVDNKETITYGTIVVDDDSDLSYVKLDGTDRDNPILTPIETTAGVANGERVVVMIKNHTAVVIGNLSSPSVRTEYVRVVEQKVSDKVAEFDILIADKVSTEEFVAEQARVTGLMEAFEVSTTRLTAAEADIDKLEADNVTIHDTLRTNNADILYLKTQVLGSDQAYITFATIEDLIAAEAKIDILESGQADLELAMANNLIALDARIDTLEANKITVTDLQAEFANIDFSNITKAAIEHFYATSGLIEDVVVGDGTITGRLVGVTISGDLIEGNTVKAEKLVIKGSDGLYYKLNTDGMKTEAQQTDENSLNGTIIKAKSITASKISVTDLVAFGATIGGINIASGALYSGAKNAVNNTTAGFYLDKNGQMALGDASKYLKYYTDAEGKRRLEISADSVLIGSSRSIEKIIEDIEVGGRNLYVVKDVENGYLASDGSGYISASGPVTKEQTSGFISVDPGDEIMYQLWVTTTDDSYVWYGYQFYGVDKLPLDANRPAVHLYDLAGGTYHVIADAITVPANAAYIRVSARMFDDGRIKIEKGNKPTDWTPAPEDMASASEVEHATDTAERAHTRIAEAEALIEVLSESISMLVTDGSGASLMTQTENGWTFSTGPIQDLANRTSESLSDLIREVGDVNGAIDILQQAVNDLGEIAEYVKIGTYESEPCIELGESDSDFRLRITNTKMIFTEGSTVLAYFNNQSLHIKKAVVEEELQQGGFVWKARSNGNLGLVWKGVSS